MKIRIKSEKLVLAVRKTDGIDIVLENTEDAKEALSLILRKADFFKQADAGLLKDVRVEALKGYDTSAVNYQLDFMVEFVFEAGASLDEKVSIIKDLQGFFETF